MATRKKKTTVVDAVGTVRATCCAHCFDHAYSAPCVPCAAGNPEVRSGFVRTDSGQIVRAK